VGNTRERSSFRFGLGITPGEQLGEVEGTGGAAPFLVLARGSGLKELPARPALPLTGLVFSWPQDQVGGNSIFFCRGYPPLVMWMRTLMEFAPDGTSRPGEPAAARGAQCFQPVRVCRCWAVAGAGGKGRSLHCRDESGSVIH